MAHLKKGQKLLTLFFLQVASDNFVPFPFLLFVIANEVILNIKTNNIWR